MGWLLDRIHTKMDGKFQWTDLFFPITAGINAITGNDYTKRRQPNLAANGTEGGTEGGTNDLLSELQQGNVLDYIENAQEATENRIEENPDISLGELVGMEETQFQKDVAENMYNAATEGIEEIAGTIDYVGGTNLEEKLEQSEEWNEIKEVSPSNTTNPSNTIEDKTTENVETKITSLDDYLKHIEEREDSAYTRAVKDMRRAGINPNLVNVQPATTTASAGIGSAQLQGEQNRELQKYLEELDLFITEDLKTSEGTKDRLTDLLTSIIMLIAFKK